MSNLSGKVIFITGASRGIGRSIALRAAQDGAKIVIVAKTTKPHPKLQGTIYTVAEEVEKAGGKALPIATDVRDEDEVRNAVSETAKHFGGIDIVVNNASAISLTNTANTSMKSYDLMNMINARGTFMCSKLCIPLMKSAANPHILNLSPPLNLHPRWFSNNLAYTISKYGMSMCVLGMAEELRSTGIAVNALWPRTAIYTAATRMLGGEGFAAQCRRPEIMSDAAYKILNMPARDPKSSGNFFVDEDLLRSLGEDDFEKYMIKPGNPLALDFFLDDYPSESQIPTPEQNAQSPTSTTTPLPSVDSIFTKLGEMLSADMVQQVNASFYLNLSGSEPGQWYIDLSAGTGCVGKAGTFEDEIAKYNTRFEMTSEDFAKMFLGQLIPSKAFMMGEMKIDGDLLAAVRLEKLMMDLNK